MNTIFSKNNRITTLQAYDLVQSGQTIEMVLPLSIGLKEDAEWLLPIEPLLSISGKNNVVKRSVAKSLYGGTVKERWSQDDFSISIQGTLIHSDLYTYPDTDVQQLIYYLQQPTALHVKNDLLALLGINQIVIESYTLPFSKGENVQNYTIEAVSDAMYELFIESK